MGNKKLVSRNSIKQFYIDLLKLISEVDNIEIKEKLYYLKAYYSKYILEEDKEFLNDLKRNVYQKMVNTKNEEENKELYKLYSSLKELN